MSINLSTFWTTWGVSSGDTSSTNQYDFWRGIIMDDNTQLSSQYDFFKYNNTTRYEFFNNLNSTYPEVWDEYTFYQNTNDPRIFDFDTFYTYAAQSLPGGGPPPPTPPVATGLVGWYVGTDVVSTGGVVDSWTDQSGNNNNLTQTVSGSKPIHNTDRVTFDGSDDFMTGSTTTTMGHVFIVMTPSGTESYGSLFSTVQKHILIRDDNSNNMFFSPVSIFLDDTVIYMRVDEISSTILGTTKQQFNTKGTPVPDLRLGVGKDFNGGTFASGDIYEILVYNVELSDTDRNTVENYLQTKYSL